MSQFIEKYSVSIAIIIAGLFVTGAVILTNFYSNSSNNEDKLAQISESSSGEKEDQESNKEIFKNVNSLSDDDHVLGKKDAKIKIVTFSDFQCPYCVSFEKTMRQAVSDYSDDVAWVYRHFPLNSHEYAIPAAVTSECVAELNGEEAFWKFMEEFSMSAEFGGNIDINNIVSSLGVNETDFNNCYDSGKYMQKINDSFTNGVESGLKGTPYSVVFIDGSPVSIINGAQPLNWVKDIVDQYLK